jgi:hypothetical protein
MPGAQILDNVQLLDEATTPSKTGMLLRNVDDLQFRKSTGAKSIPTLTNTTLLSAGSIPFVTGAAGEFTQNNANLFWDSANSRLGLMTNTPATTLDIGSKFQVRNSAAVLTITQPAQNGGTGPTMFSATGGAHTTLDAGTETTDVLFNLQRTINVNSGAGIPNQRSVRIRPPTFTATGGAVTIADADTVVIEGPTTGGSNITITEACTLSLETRALTNVTNAYGLHCDAPSGATNNYAARFTGQVLVNSFTTADALARLLVTTGATTNKGLVLQAFSAGQTADLLQAQSSVGAVLFSVSATGDLTTIKGVGYTWPAANSAGVLTNNGTGTLTWSAAGSGTVTTSGAPAATQVAFFSAGTVITGDAGLYWDNVNKRLGINQAVPVAPLQVQGVANANAVIIDGSATVGQSYGLTVRAGTNASDRGFTVQNQAGSVNYFVVRGDGNVAIGTTTSIIPLTVSAATGYTASSGIVGFQNPDYVATSAGSSLVFRFGANTGATYSEILALQTGGSAFNNLVMQSGGGNVGIGTATLMNGKLNIVGSEVIYTSGADDSSLAFLVSGGVAQIQSTFYSTGSYKPLAFYAGGTERMRILTTGNVGIGTASPGFPLEVSKPAGVSVGVAGFFTPGATNGQQMYVLQGKSASPNEGFYCVYNHNSSAASRYIAWQGTESAPGGVSMCLTAGGLVGIGTIAPAVALNVQAASGYSAPQGILQLQNPDFAAGSAGASLVFRFGAATGVTYSEILALHGGGGAYDNLVMQTGGGQVGIGTSAPAAGIKLDVVGTIRLQGASTPPASIVGVGVYADTGIRFTFGGNTYSINVDVGTGISVGDAVADVVKIIRTV